MLRNNLARKNVLTVTLNGVMSYSTEHGKLRVLAKTETLAHPREKVGQAIVSPTNTFWNASATTREGQCTDTVWPKWDLWIDIGLFLARCQRVLETDTREDGPV